MTDRIELPSVPESIRRYVLSYWGRQASQDPATDPRWTQEALRLPETDFDLHGNTAAAHDALSRAGIETLPLPFQTYMSQGHDTFGLLLATDRTWAIRVSELGPVVDVAHNLGFCYGSPELLPGPKGDDQSRMVQTLEAAGFEIVTESCLKTLFVGLHVYCFAPSQVLPVHDLLFYWQD